LEAIDMKRTLDAAATVLAGLLLLGFALLSVRGIIDPQAASAQFGSPVSDAAGGLYYRVYMSRNLALAATGLLLLLTRQWRSVAILITVTVALPVFDMTVLSLNGVTPPFVHPVALVLIALTAGLLWRRVANEN
jgi:hypothetical protein